MEKNSKIRIVARHTGEEEITVYCEDWDSSKPLGHDDYVCCEGEKALVELTCLRELGPS